MTAEEAMIALLDERLERQVTGGADWSVPAWKIRNDMSSGGEVFLVLDETDGFVFTYRTANDDTGEYELTGAGECDFATLKELLGGAL